MELLHEPELWVGVGLAVVLALFAWFRVPKMLAKHLDARAAAIVRELDEAKRLREEAAELLASYVHKAAQAESEAAAIIDEAKLEAEHAADRAKDQLSALIERRAQVAEDRIAQAEAAALDEIRRLTADAAVAAAEKLIAARLDEERSAALVEESIKELTDKLN